LVGVELNQPVTGDELVEPVAEPPAELVEVELLSPQMPDPSRGYYWFSTTPLPDRRISAGCPVWAGPGSRLPPEADYWCHEREPWVEVDRSVYPKPKPKPKQKAKSRESKPRRDH
jgi:hypothetical protein